MPVGRIQRAHLAILLRFLPLADDKPSADRKRNQIDAVALSAALSLLQSGLLPDAER
jgi:hypothetical protein